MSVNTSDVVLDFEGNRYTFDEIADIHGVSRQRIHQIVQRYAPHLLRERNTPRDRKISAVIRFVNGGGSRVAAETEFGLTKGQIAGIIFRANKSAARPAAIEEPSPAVAEPERTEKESRMLVGDSPAPETPQDRESAEREHELQERIETERRTAGEKERRTTRAGNSRICVTRDCRGPKQPGRDICATCITKAYVARRDAA